MTTLQHVSKQVMTFTCRLLPFLICNTPSLRTELQSTLLKHVREHFKMFRKAKCAPKAVP